MFRHIIIPATMLMLGVIRSTAAPTFSGADLACRATTRVADGQAQLDLTLRNRGETHVYDACAEVTWSGSTTCSPTQSIIEAGTQTNTAIHLGPIPAQRGIYTAIIKIHYTDLTGAPFSLLTSQDVITGLPDTYIPGAQASLDTITQNKHRVIMATISNQTLHPLTVHLKFQATEDGLFATNRMTLVVPPRACASTALPTTCRAKPAYTPQTFLAVLDYDIDAYHQSTALHTTIPPLDFALSVRQTDKKLFMAAIACLAIFTLLQFRRTVPAPEARKHRIRQKLPALFTAGLLTILCGIIFWQLTPTLLFTNTTTVGGDTPAHHYLASHLRDQLFHHGHIVSWADGWWCGFPMFQFYFCLPYALMAALGMIIPHNIAFKLVSVMGMALLPFCAWLAAQRARLPRPTALFMAIATLPLLFDGSHTMWGVNIYSTLAGMIANSISFAIMLLYVACAFRDAEDGVFRIRTVLLLCGLLASHFFTTLIAVLSLAMLPLLQPAGHRLQAARVITLEGLLAGLIMAWWLVPLVIKTPYAMDFGTNWEVSFRRQFSPLHIALLPAVIVAVATGIRRRHAFTLMMAWSLVTALLLFRYGYTCISPVFVNVRLWPFIQYAWLALAALGLGALCTQRRAVEWAVLGILALALTTVVPQSHSIRGWATWNYEGLEKKAIWPLFQELTQPLAHTPGRLAYDLHDGNNRFGSSRIFELVPHLTGKPILEGGLVNSALTSMFSYYIQGETSDTCAGYPTIVQPATFNWVHAVRHLELFNVKHFIARSPRTQQALRQDNAHWRLIKAAGGWELFEMTSHKGNLVFIPAHAPQAVSVRDWKAAAMAWMYTPAALDFPFILLQPGQLPPAGSSVLNSNDYRRCLDTLPADGQGAGFKAATNQTCITHEECLPDGRLRFQTTAIGQPHIIKRSYFPNWKVYGADGVYMVTPGFLLVYPRQAEVELYYGRTPADNLGMFMTLTGLILLLGALTRKRR